MDSKKIYYRYYRVSVHGSMPQLDNTEIDAWTIATSRPRGCHIEHGTTVEYDYWIKYNEITETFNTHDSLIMALEQLNKVDADADNFFNASKDDNSYRDLYFRVLENDEWRDIDGIIKSETRPADVEPGQGRGDYRSMSRETYKTLHEVIEQYPELLPTAIYIHDTFKPEAVGEALPF